MYPRQQSDSSVSQTGQQRDVSLVAVSTSFPLRPGHSAGIFVERLYQHLPKTWFVEVICPDDDRPSVLVCENGRIRTRPTRYAPRRCQVLAQRAGGIAAGIKGAPWRAVFVPGLLVALWWRCLTAARRSDLLHANWAVSGVIAATVARLIGRPLVTTLRGDDVTRAERSMLDRWLLDTTMRESAAVICVSEAMAADLCARYPDKASSIHVCLNGVHAAFLNVRRSPPEPGLLRIVSVGSLIERKGYDVLVEAVARMRFRDAISLRIAGAGPNLHTLQERVHQLGIADRVEFVGELPPTEIPRFLGDGDLFVLPSRSEGRPNVVLEALAAGLPVVSTALPGIDKLVEPGVNGWRVAVDDPNGLAEAMDHAYADPQGRERRATAARESVLSGGHDWGTTGARYDSVFRGILETTGAEQV